MIVIMKEEEYNKLEKRIRNGCLATMVVDNLVVLSSEELDLKLR